MGLVFNHSNKNQPSLTNNLVSIKRSHHKGDSKLTSASKKILKQLGYNVRKTGNI